MYYVVTFIASAAGGGAAFAIADTDKFWWGLGVFVFLLALLWAGECLLEIFD